MIAERACVDAAAQGVVATAAAAAPGLVAKEEERATRALLQVRGRA